MAEKQQPEEASLRCPICGTQLVAGKCPQCQQQKVYPLVRREIWVLVLVAVATIPLYLFTREAAIENRARRTRTAAYWFERGQEQLRAGDADAAIAWFHRATIDDRENFEYGLALANALAAGGYPDESQLALLSLRDSAPEDSRINLQLARLVAQRDDLNGAVHYYRNALYGVWPNGDGNRQRREARMELIHFLLDRAENNIALSELLLLSAELPEDPASFTEVARLMMDAGDPQQALEHFDRAIAIDDTNTAAQAGAGEASFQLKDYRSAIRYLQATLAQDENLEQSQELLEVSRFVLSRDPTAPRLSQQARARRMIANFDSVFSKLEACLDEEMVEDLSARLALAVLRSEGTTLEPRLVPRTFQREAELLDVAMDFIYRTLVGIGSNCGTPSTLERALLVIGRNYRGGEA